MRRILMLAACAALAACGTRGEQGGSATAAAASATTAPDSFQVQFQTSRGPFTVAVTRALSPQGADRFYHLVAIGYFTDVRFFRVVPGFVAQFGMSGDPKVNAKWSADTIPDEPVKESNARGTIVFAKAGPNSRSNQFFINLVDNARLDAMGFPPFGQVVSGMSVVDSLYSAYGEQPAQQMISAQGNQYLERAFPKLDYIKSATIVGGSAATTEH